MISYLEGKIIFKTKKFIILDVKGVGYKVFLSQRALSKIPEISQNLNPSVKLRVDTGRSRSTKLFCFLDVRENKLDLYGFLNFQELEFFEILDDIPGVGPKAALEISSLGPLEKIKEKILAQDEKIFEGIPGIGRKKAMAIILELSGKIKEITKEKTKKTDEVETALINLGFSRQRVKEVLAKIPQEIKDTQEKIKQALKILGRG